MFTPEESALLLDLSPAAVQRLRQLNMQQAQAQRRGDEKAKARSKGKAGPTENDRQ